jgi:uncharacterized repeat protein (TIGR01451 family)
MKHKVDARPQSHKLATFIWLVVFFVQSGFVAAEQDDSVKKIKSLVIALTAKKVVSTAGKESFSTADKVKPGDVVEYRAQYTNVSKAVIKGVMADLPVPKGMEYVKDSARPTVVLATVDGKVYEPVPLKRKVKDSTGKEVTQLVPLPEYRSLRWALGDIPIEKELAVSARMQISK